jgi:hypothetical protein
MKFNYILLGIAALLLCLYLANGSTYEGQQNEDDDKIKFTLDTEVMRKFGDGCCRHAGWEKGAKNKGRRTIRDCLKKCENDPNCWAVDYKNPIRDKYQCTIYSGKEEPQDLHLECDKRTKCFKKVVTGSAVCEVPESCPVQPKAKKSRISIIGDEEFEDKNEEQLETLDSIQKGLAEIVGLQQSPSPCADDPNACRPGALTEDQFTNWLKAEETLTKETCKEPEPSAKCNPPEKQEENISEKLTNEEIQNVLKERCKVIIDPEENKVDPPNFKDPVRKNLEKNEEQETVLEKPKPEIIDEDIRSSIKEKVKAPEINPAAFNSGDDEIRGQWKQITHKHEKPKDGKDMYRELSTPAFQRNKSKGGLFSSV